MVLRAAEGKDPLQTWESWELNCLWAADQIDGRRNQRLIDFLARTDKYENQAWILKAFDQLVEADRSPSEPLVRVIVPPRSSWPRS